MTRLAGKIAIVTGGAKGIGQATVEAFVANGARVLLADRDDAAGRAVIDVLTAAGADVAFQACDVTVPKQVTGLVDIALSRWGRLDVAVNNAGTTPGRSSLAKLDLSDWDAIIATNLTSVFLGLKSQIPAIGKSGGGAIVNVASTNGLRGSAGLGAYSASKHGVIGLTKSAALEAAGRGVRVNAVCPGAIQTPLLDDTFTTDDERAALKRLSPMGRVGDAAEVANLIAWLCSPEAGFVTGAAYTIDGGMTAS